MGTVDENGPLENKVIVTGNIRKVSLDTLLDNLNFKYHCFKTQFFLYI